MFGLGMVPKENFLAYSSQFVFLTITLVLWNVLMVAIDTCAKSPITGEWIYPVTWKYMYFNISVLSFFILDNTSILKLVFPITYCFCLDSLLSGCVAVIIVVVAFFSVIITYLCYHGYHHYCYFCYTCVIFCCKYCR